MFWKSWLSSFSPVFLFSFLSMTWPLSWMWWPMDIFTCPLSESFRLFLVSFNWKHHKWLPNVAQQQVCLDVGEWLRAVLTPPGAQCVWDEAWNTFGASFPILEYVMTEEEENEWLLESDAMFSWKKQLQKHLRNYLPITAGHWIQSSIHVWLIHQCNYWPGVRMCSEWYICTTK